MLRRMLYLLTIVFAISSWGGPAAKAQNQPAGRPVLQGTVSSASEGPMEGVLVKAKRAGSNITVTVVSNDKGYYAYPANRLAAGQYDVDVRAGGYELETQQHIEILGGKTTELNLKLKPASDVSSQLMNAEWLMSFPDSKKKEAVECVACHPLSIPTHSRYQGDEWLPILAKMRNYAPGANLWKPQKNPYDTPEPPNDAELLKYLSSINFSSGKWQYELKTFPRPKGRATRVIITEYDLPTRAAGPHDVLVDKEGIVWYSDFGRPLLGKLDPRTGAVQEYPLPILKPGYPEGANPTELDEFGNVYVGRLKQAALAKLDRKTGEITQWSIPAEYQGPRAHLGMIAPVRNGVLWFSDNPNRRMHRIDTKTGKIESYPAFPDSKEVVYGDAGYMSGPEQGHSIYGLSSDSKGNGYILDISGGTIGKIEPGTGKVTLYPTPTPKSGPRRGMMDDQDRLWFGEYNANKVAMFDTKTGKFQEWPVPGPYARPYDVRIDKNGEVWAGGMHTDYVYRFNPKTGEWTQYLLPSVAANLRRMAGVDNSTPRVTVYVGENHQGKIAKIEPLD